MPARLEHRVEIVTATLADDGGLLGHAVRSGDGAVLAALGAGHVSPAALREVDRRGSSSTGNHQGGALVDAV